MDAKWVVYNIAPFVMILLACLTYAQTLRERAPIVTEKFGVKNILPKGLPYSITKEYANVISEATHHDKKIFFLDFIQEYELYIQTKTVPPLKTVPNDAYIMLDTFVKDCQKLLDDGYQVVAIDLTKEKVKRVVRHLDYNVKIVEPYFIILRKDKIPAIFESNPHEVCRIANKYPVNGNLIEHKELTLDKNFSIQLAIKPDNATNNNAAIIMENITQMMGNTGFTLQTSSSDNSKIIFGYGDGKNDWVTLPTISLRVGAWNYIALNFEDNMVRMFVNGIEANFPYIRKIKNNRQNLLIGGNNVENNNYKGHIREVLISNKILTNKELQHNFEKVKTLD